MYDHYKELENIQLRLEYLANPKKPHIILTVGVSGSGKSTYACSLVDNNPDYVRVNRDEVRAMLFGFMRPEDHSAYYKSKGIGKKEELVTEVEDNIIMAALHIGKNVIVDATHLKMKYINRFRKLGHPVELHIFNPPLETCVDRDRLRERTVGREIIERQYDSLMKLAPQLGFEEAFRPF